MKKSTLFIQKLLFILFSFWGCYAYSKTWVSLNNSSGLQDYSIKVLESNATVYKVQFAIHGFTDSVIVEKDAKYHLLSMSSGTHLTNVGEPQLPTVSQLIALPGEVSYNVTILEGKWKEIDMENVYPVQKDYKENEPKPEFEILKEIYQKPSYIPDLVTIEKEQVWRSIHNVCISVCPFKYSPTKRKLSVLTNFVLEIDFSDILGQAAIRSSDKTNAMFWRVFANDISSFPTKEDNCKSFSPLRDYDYLIIVGDNPSIRNSQALKDFQRWKTFKGYKTKVVSTSTIGSTPELIKNYIHQEYNNYNISYVLFIGDNDKIPLKNLNYKGEDVGSDYWYGCFNSDDAYLASVPIGRFSTNNLSDFQNMVDKTINYEKSYNGNYQNTLLVAHKEDAPYKYQQCSNEIRNFPYSSSLIFRTAYGASSEQGIDGDSATNSQVVNHINDGMHIVNYRGHGEERYWGIYEIAKDNRWNIMNELFEGNQVNNMEKCAIFFNVCCQTGSIDDEPCMLESLTRSSHGAIACLAATEETYTTANHYYNKFLFKNLLNYSMWHLGELNIFSYADAISTQGSDARYNALASVCGGDPSLEIWTGTPIVITGVSLAQMEGNLVVSSSSFNYGDKICIVSEDGDLIKKDIITGSNYITTMPIGNFYIVINKHNAYPHITYCSESGYIQNETLTDNYFYRASPLYIGYDITTEKPYGNVVIESGAKLSIQNGASGVTIKNGFECKLGGELTIE